MLTGAAAGCGSAVRDPISKQFLFASPCDRENAADSAVPDLVVLDWTGGRSPIYADDGFPGVDLSLFRTDNGGSLGDDPATFKELVRREIEAIYCDWPEAQVLVVEGEDYDEADTVVHITQALQPRFGSDIGEGEYDVCNLQNDNSAIIFGERLRLLGDVYARDEWVKVFANVCAHEIGHTLGYGHVNRDGVSDAGRQIYVELMLDRHTMAEMRRAQRFVFDQTNCPRSTTARRIHGHDPFIACSLDERRGE